MLFVQLKVKQSTVMYNLKHQILPFQLHQCKEFIASFSSFVSAQMKIWINNTSHRFSQLCWQFLLDLHSDMKQLLMNNLCKSTKPDLKCDTTTHTERKYTEAYWKINIFTPPAYKDRIGWLRMAVKQWL